jgi:hypothetical protein
MAKNNRGFGSRGVAMSHNAYLQAIGIHQEKSDEVWELPFNTKRHREIHEIMEQNKGFLLAMHREDLVEELEELWQTK